MFNRKIFLSLCIFTIFMVMTSIIKNKTRVLEKKIFIHERDIANIKKNIHEAQLDYSYLSSPANIEEQVRNYSNEEYTEIDFSKIYLNLETFLKAQNTRAKSFTYEKKKEKK